MASESGQKASSSSTSTADSYIGSFISLISKYEIRYDGVLYYLNPQDSTIGLKNVRSYGTEGRKKDGPQLPSSDKVYEYILFRGSDIKDLQVKSSQPTLTEEQIHDDPAIIQSHYAGGPSGSSPSASVGGGALTEPSSFQDTPALTTRAYPGALPSYQSGTQVGQWGHSQTIQNVGVPSYAIPMYWQGYNGTQSSISQAPQHPSPFQPTSTMSFPSTVQNQLQAPEILASPTMGLTNTSECVTPVPLLTVPNSVHPNFPPILTPEQCSTPTDMPSSLSLKASLPSHSASMSANRLTTSSFPSSCQDINTIEAPIVGKAVSDTLSVLPVQSLPYSASSIVGSTSCPLLTLPPTLLTPNQLSQLRPPVLSPTQKLYSDQKDMGALTPTSPNSSSSVTTPVVQAPLLPLPLSAQQSRCSTTQFTEEFDFIAMNEKFKKDEVWGYLGKGKQRDKIEGPEDSAIGQSLGAEEGHGLVPKFDRKPAYNKDEFFDAISCNSLARGAKNEQNRFSERMKLDTETFGNFQQRPHLGYGGYGAGRGENYRGSYNWGRGYGYGGRGYGYGGRGYGYGGRGRG